MKTYRGLEDWRCVFRIQVVEHRDRSFASEAIRDRVFDLKVQSEQARARVSRELDGLNVMSRECGRIGRGYNRINS